MTDQDAVTAVLPSFDVRGQVALVTGAPRYTALGALREALAWLADHGQADIGGQPFAGDA